MWVTNSIIGDLHFYLFGKPANGLWMNALLNDFISKKEHQLVIVTTGRNKEIIKVDSEQVVYYLLPGGFPIEYNHLVAKNKRYWMQIIEKEKPDLIQVWGSEFKHGLCALQAAPQIPSVIYMQGVLAAIARYYEAGIERKEIIKHTTLLDIIKQDSILQQKKKYYTRAVCEKEMFDISGNVIGENLWCKAHCEAISPNVKVHFCPLSINEIFAKFDYDVSNVEPYTLMCNAAGYPLKGLHILLRALVLVKEKYPSVKLYVPGTPLVVKKDFASQIRKRGYFNYIEKLIQKLDLNDNIFFIGPLTPEQMADRMSKINIFVVCSALENHSSTLKEAMMVGLPCISSNVGGVPEYVKHGENGMLYRFEEYELLAEYIRNIFDDKVLAQKIGDAAKETARKLHDSADIYNKIIGIYKNILDGTKS